jgi:hypothetical protein
VDVTSSSSTPSGGGSLVTLESDTNLLVGIIGGVFGAVMAVTLCVVLAIVCRRKSKKGESNNGGAGAQAQAAANAAPARTGEYGVIQLTMLRNSKNKDNKDNGNNKENNGALHQYDMMPDDAAAAAAPSEGDGVCSVAVYAERCAIDQQLRVGAGGVRVRERRECRVRIDCRV